MRIMLHEGSDGADTAIDRAHSAFVAGRRQNRRERADWLDAIGQKLEDHRAELIDIAHQESHLTEGRLNGELTRTVFQLQLLADETRSGQFLEATIDHPDPNWGMGPRPDIRRFQVPLGVVGVFGASNFPFAFSVIGGDSASALAAGCSVVHKVHDGHPELGRRTVELVSRALSEAGAPDGLFTGIRGTAAAQELVEHPLTKAIGFTGSQRVGRMLFDKAMARENPIPFYGEFGSLNPVVVTESAWSARSTDILTGFVGSMNMGIGQFCTKPGLVFVPEKGVDQMHAELPRMLWEHANSHPMLTPAIHSGFIHARDEIQQDPSISAISAGDDSNPPVPALLMARAADVKADSPALTTEMFGPAAVVVTYQSDDELLNVLTHLPGQLTTTLHNEDDEDTSALVNALTDIGGRILRNGWPTGVTVSYAQHHGGPSPATTTTETSVGTAAITRFTRPVAFQNFEQKDLPSELQDKNPLGIPRRVNGKWNT